MSQVTVKYEDGLKSSLMNPDEAAAYLNVVTNRKPTASGHVTSGRVKQLVVFQTRSTRSVE